MDREIKNQKSSDCSCLNLRRASQAVTELYNGYMTTSGLNISQYSLLRHVRKLQPVNVSDLAQEMRLDRTTLVRNLKPLEERGLVLDASETGTRNRQLKLTEAGAKTLNEAELLWMDAQNYLEQSMGRDDLNTLTGLLAKIEALKP